MYLRVSINDGGFIRPSLRGTTIHRESRQMHWKWTCSPTLDEAKASLLSGHAVLELTAEGGGSALWVRGCDRERWEKLLKIWNGCYGAWPVHTMKEV